MDKKKVKELIEQIQKYCDQCYNPNWQPKSFEEFVKLGNICREAIKELSKSDWVSVEDGLPEYGEEVLVCNKKKVGGVSMAWLVVDRDGSEYIFANKPYRNTDPHFGSRWDGGWISCYVSLPKGSIKKLIGRELKWEDSPVELK